VDSAPPMLRRNRSPSTSGTGSRGVTITIVSPRQTTCGQPTVRDARVIGLHLLCMCAAASAAVDVDETK